MSVWKPVKTCEFLKTHLQEMPSGKYLTQMHMIGYNKLQQKICYRNHKVSCWKNRSHYSTPCSLLSHTLTALLHYFSVWCAKIYLDLSLKLLKQSAQVWSLSQPHSNWLATQYQKLLIWGSHRNTTCVQMHEWISRREQVVPALARQKGGDGRVLLTFLAWVPAGLADRAEFQRAVTTAYQLWPGRVRLLQLAHGLARWWRAPCPARVQQHLCGGEQKNSVCVYPFYPAVYGHVTMVTLRRLSIRLFSVNLP